MNKGIVVVCLLFTLFLSGCKTVNRKFDEIEEKIKLTMPESIDEDINLITEDPLYNATIMWTSSNEEVLSSSGENKNKANKTINITLTYTINIKDKQRVGEIKIDVNRNIYLFYLYNVEQFTVLKVNSYVTKDLDLPTVDSEYDAIIEWWSSNEEVLTSTGKNKNTTKETIEVVLYYRITINGYIKEGQKKFSVHTQWAISQLNYVEEQITQHIPSSTVEDIKLINSGYGETTKIKWESSNNKVIDTNGKVYNFGDVPVIVTLTYTITVGDEKRVGTIQVEVPPTENYTFELSSDHIYVGVNCEPEISGAVSRNNKWYKYVSSNYRIVGYYDLTKPGLYKVIASVDVDVKRQAEDGSLYLGTMTFEQPFTLEVVDLKLLNMKELNNFGFIAPYNTFSVDKYFIVCYTNVIYIYDLDNSSIYHTINVKGLCNSFYYKDGYLYICSRAPYSYVDGNEFSGYVIQINLDTYTILKEYNVDFAPNSIAIDQRNNAILSSEQQSNIKYLNMDTGNITSICECMENDTIIYNEDEDIFILVGKSREKEQKIYKYNTLNNQFILLNKETNTLKNLYLGTYIMVNYKNTWINDSYYVVLENEDVTLHEIIYIDWDRYDLLDIYNGEDGFVVLRYSNFFNVGYITVYNKITHNYHYYKIVNYIPGEYESIHLYNNNVYLFDSKTGKLYITQ